MKNKPISLSASVSNPNMGMLLTRLTCHLLSRADSRITTSTPILQWINYADSQQQIAWAKFHVVLTSQQEALQNYYTDVLWSSFPYISVSWHSRCSLNTGINLKFCFSFPFYYILPPYPLNHFFFLLSSPQKNTNGNCSIWRMVFVAGVVIFSVGVLMVVTNLKGRIQVTIHFIAPFFTKPWLFNTSKKIYTLGYKHNTESLGQPNRESHKHIISI